MHWNHRIVRTGKGRNKSFAIHEAYYEGTKVTGCTENPTPVVAESKKELRRVLVRMLAALDKPVIKGD